MNSWFKSSSFQKYLVLKKVQWYLEEKTLANNLSILADLFLLFFFFWVWTPELEFGVCSLWYQWGDKNLFFYSCFITVLQNCMGNPCSADVKWWPRFSQLLADLLLSLQETWPVSFVDCIFCFKLYFVLDCIEAGIGFLGPGYHPVQLLAIT